MKNIAAHRIAYLGWKVDFSLRLREKHLQRRVFAYRRNDRNENGTVYDPTLNDVIATAISSSPFGFEDVFVYSHGWSTDADRALVDYDVFSIGLMRRILQESQKPLALLIRLRLSRISGVSTRARLPCPSTGSFTTTVFFGETIHLSRLMKALTRRLTRVVRAFASSPWAL